VGFIPYGLPEVQLSCIYKLKGKLLRNTFVSILQLGVIEVLPLGGAQCYKKIADGPMNTALSKNKIQKSYFDVM
jgi:hypothetical protein